LLVQQIAGWAEVTSISVKKGGDAVGNL